MHKKNNIISSLFAEFNEPIRDPLWKHIYLSPGLKKICSSEEFQQLGRIKQLGPTFHVYPGAVHTRLSHSLGVFHIAKKILQTLATHPQSPVLSLEESKAFLCAALLHDLGHFPFAHSLKELPLKEHETLGAEMILSGKLKQTIKQELNIDPYYVAAIIDESININNSGISFYRNLLSGVLDPDKLDYLNRDAYFCGVPYGTQDIDFVINKLVPRNKYGIALRQSGITAVENILFSKYLMYRTVYWHHTVRIATAMIKKAIYMSIQNDIITPQELYGLDDEQFFLLLSKYKYAPYSLIKQVTERKLYKTAFEVDFISTDREHQTIVALDKRYYIEENLARILTKTLKRRSTPLKPQEVIIDIPEPISFEINIPVVETALSATDNDTITRHDNFLTTSSSVFTKPVIDNFTSSLRKIRLFLPEAVVNETLKICKKPHAIYSLFKEAVNS